MNKAYIKGVEYYLPENILDNDELVSSHSDWTADKIENKTGISKRHIAKKDEHASDLAVNAANLLFKKNICTPTEIDFILFCTQSPDYLLPTTACLLQNRLGIPTTAGALDFNLGCSGYVYGLSLAKGLIETGQAEKVLLLTSDTYSKYLDPDDIKVKIIFGDGASATFIDSTKEEQELLGPFVFGTDGRGKDKLIVEQGGSRSSDSSSIMRKSLYMDGPSIFAFTIKSVPSAVEKLLNDANKTINDIDYFIFHQANQYMLTHLQKKIGIPDDKFCIDIQDYGNTVSSSIPITLSNLMKKNKGSKKQLTLMFVGFGVGYSWGATLCNLQFKK